MNKEKVLKTTFNILSRRDHTSYELTNKLKKKKYNSSLIKYALSECKRLKLLDDDNFAINYLLELQNKGYGRLYIKKYLLLKGFSANYADNLIQEKILDEDEIKLIKQNIEKKKRTLTRETDPQKKREKIFRYLLSRGFLSYLINDTMQSLR